MEPENWREEITESPLEKDCRRLVFFDDPSYEMWRYFKTHIRDVRNKHKGSADVVFHSQKLTDQVPKAVRSQLNYLMVFRRTFEVDELYRELMVNTNSKKLTHPLHNAEQLKALLMRPFRCADKKQSKEDKRAGKKTKGFVMCNLDSGRFFWNFDHMYDMTDRYSVPTPLPEDEAFPLMTPNELLKYGK
jgi:hypothetical protein